MADTICKARGAQPVGVNWPNTFIKRTLRLQVKLRRTYECQRKLYEDPQVIRGWFELIKNTINIDFYSQPKWLDYRSDWPPIDPAF
jgi:hypothetical protein